MGDLNAHHPSWNCKGTNAHGRGLYNYVNRHQLALLYPDGPTHYPDQANYTPSTIDIALVKNITNYSDVELLDELDSNHLPILLEPNGSEGAALRNPRTRLNYKKNRLDQVSGSSGPKLDTGLQPEN